MAKLNIPEDKKPASAPTVPKTCGVAGCTNETDVYIKEKGIARCHKHYQEDVDQWGKTHQRGSASRYSIPMMEELLEEFQNVKSGGLSDQVNKVLSKPSQSSSESGASTTKTKSSIGQKWDRDYFEKLGYKNLDYNEK